MGSAKDCDPEDISMRHSSDVFCPQDWERVFTFEDREVFIRPIRSEDAQLIVAFLHKVSAEDLRLRFFGSIREFSPSFIQYLTKLDYERAMAFVAFDKSEKNILGVIRLHMDPHFDAGEYAVLVRSDLKGHGLGWKLMALLIEYARKINLPKIKGEVLSENSTMLTMCREFGFSIFPNPDDATVKLVILDLSEAAASSIFNSEPVRLV